MHGLLLVHDLLDSQLVDRREQKIGRVDSLVLELRANEPPRVAAILIGGPVREKRVGRWLLALERAMRSLVHARSSGVSRVPFAAMRRVARDIQIDVDGDQLEATHVERWLAEHVVAHIPGAGSDEGSEQK